MKKIKNKNKLYRVINFDKSILDNINNISHYDKYHLKKILSKEVTEIDNIKFLDRNESVYTSLFLYEELSPIKDYIIRNNLIFMSRCFQYNPCLIIKLINEKNENDLLFLKENEVFSKVDKKNLYYKRDLKHSLDIENFKKYVNINENDKHFVATILLNLLKDNDINDIKKIEIIFEKYLNRLDNKDKDELLLILYKLSISMLNDDIANMILTKYKDFNSIKKYYSYEEIKEFISMSYNIFGKTGVTLLKYLRENDTEKYKEIYSEYSYLLSKEAITYHENIELNNTINKNIAVKKKMKL